MHYGGKSMPQPFENQRINPNILTTTLFQGFKMPDYYLGVTFRYTAKTWNGCIPLKAKYQGINIQYTKEDVDQWILECYSCLAPGNNMSWQREQNDFWAERKAFATQAVFDALNGDGDMTKWLCRKCGPAPDSNPQAGGRISALRKYGYHIATTKMNCATCGGLQFFDLLIRLPRCAANNEKRFSISTALRKRIKTVLPLQDACFSSPQTSNELIIDHKFPSSRWVYGETVNHVSMTDDEIKQKFQLLTNQSNLQKERYCQRCVISGVRGDYFGIKWYYEGNDLWCGSSKADEDGCIGCCWYDLLKWKEKLNEYIKTENTT
jgi:hypothetical protein